jgi:esterase/lipase superfamily enzyme
VPRDGDTTARDSVSAREPAEPRPEPAEATDDEPAAAAPESGSAGGPGAPAATEAEAPPPRRTRGITTAPSPAVPPPPTTMSGAEPAGGPDATLAPPPPAAAPAAAPSSPPPAGAAENKETFDIVPVFFGTDRQRLDNPKRVDYGYDRARKLDLGRALVTIPKVHQVPQIERPWVVKIPYFDVTIYEEAEDPARHFTMQEIKTLSREELLGLVRARLASSRSFKDHAFIFVHGFNTSFDHAVYRTAQVANDLKFDGAPFLYSWPSGGGVASYTYDRESSGQAEPFMRDFMTLVVKETGARAVSIIAHSMGNQPVLQVLRDLKRDMPDGVAISQIILAAPDVDRDNFENIAKEIRGLAKGVTLYVAANDRALGVSRRFYGGVPRAGDVPPTGPLVLPDIDTIDITAVSTDSLGLNHSSYAENNALLNDIALLIQTGERPPDKRIPILTRVPSAKGDYWRYPSVP